MPRFHIIPADDAFPRGDLIAQDAASVLYLVERLGFQAADVEQDGAHAFSVRLADSGLWSISRRRITARSFY